MREITFEETKKIELDILLDIDRFCRENRLTYFLAYGTLIGAVRHHGFIPWDDDIDIQMPRADYNRMIELYNNSNHSNGKYYLVSPYDKVAKHSFVKVIDVRTVKIEPGFEYGDNYLGIDVDIFPLDGIPDQTKQFDIWFSKLKKVYRKFEYCVLSANKGSIKHRMFLYFMKFFYRDKNKYLKQAEIIHSKNTYESSDYVGIIESSFCSKKNRTLKKNFKNGIPCIFEGYEFIIPENYDQNLIDIYGDYMTLPPIEEQVTHHQNKVYWKE